MLRPFLILSFALSYFSLLSQDSFLLQMTSPNKDTVHELSTKNWKKIGFLNVNFEKLRYQTYLYQSTGGLIEIDNISGHMDAKFTIRTVFKDSDGSLKSIPIDSCYGKNVVDGIENIFSDKKGHIYYYGEHYGNSQFHLFRLNFKNKDLDTILKTEFVKEKNAEAIRAHMAAYRDKIVMFYHDGKERPTDKDSTLVRVYDYDFKQIQEDFYIPMDVRATMVLRDKCRGDQIYIFERTDRNDIWFYESVTVHKFDLASKTILPDPVAKIPMLPFVGIRVVAPPYQKIEVDLNADDPSSYDYATHYCGGFQSSPIAKNVCLQSWMPPDSIILQLSGTIDGDKESLAYSGADCTLSHLGSNRYRLTLNNPHAFVTDGYVTALQEIRYINNLSEPSVGTRQIDITTYYKGKSKKVTSTIHVLDKNPHAGRDTTLSLCKHHVISNLANTIKASPGGTWVTSLSSTDAFDPSTDTWRSNQYVVGNEYCGTDTLHLTIELTDHTYASRTVTICPEDTYTHKGKTYNPMQSFQDTVAHGGNDCDSIYNVNIAAYKSPSKQQYIYVCSGDSVTHNGTQYAAGESYNYPISSNNSCDTIVTARVIAHPSLPALLPDTIYISKDTSIRLTADTWSISSIHPVGINHNSQELHIPFKTDAVRYNINWNIQHCSERTILTIIPTDSKKKNEFISFPNVIARNPSNQINGIFALKSSSKIAYALTMYDRWGNVIYQNNNLDSSNRLDGWDVRNSHLKTGVYVYHIQVSGSQKVYIGEVTVL